MSFKTLQEHSQTLWLKETRESISNWFCEDTRVVRQDKRGSGVCVGVWIGAERKYENRRFEEEVSEIKQ